MSKNQLGFDDMAKAYEDSRMSSRVNELQQFRVTFACPWEILSLIDATSDMYRKNRTEVLIDLLQTATMQFFCELPSATRKDLAKRADQILIRELKQAFKDADGSLEFHGVYWEGLAVLTDASLADGYAEGVNQ